MPQETSKAAQSKRGEKGHAHSHRSGLAGDYQPATSGGSHFKPAGAAQTRPGSKAVAPVPRLDVKPAKKAQSPVAPSEERVQGAAAVPHRSSKKKKRAGGKASPYSRYNTRYAEISSTGSHPDGMAFDWWPYCIYGAASVLLTLVWCVVSIVSSDAIKASMPVVGIVLLCAIVVVGIALAAVLSVLTLRKEKDLDTVDVCSAAIGRMAIMMVGSVVIWILASAIISL